MIVIYQGNDKKLSEDTGYILKKELFIEGLNMRHKKKKGESKKTPRSGSGQLEKNRVSIN